ncbi:hypothetical protein HYY69_06370 [Candidatus Woesearchaeota archaeon]|nr:hypothetical protein [Candidatus Woesearchaeota archaeon]
MIKNSPIVYGILSVISIVIVELILFLDDISIKYIWKWKTYLFIITFIAGIILGLLAMKLSKTKEEKQLISAKVGWYLGIIGILLNSSLLLLFFIARNIQIK